MALSSADQAIWNAPATALKAAQIDAAFGTFVDGIGSNDTKATAVLTAAKTATGATNAKAALAGINAYLDQARAYEGYAVPGGTKFQGDKGNPLKTAAFAALLVAAKAAAA